MSHPHYDPHNDPNARRRRRANRRQQRQQQQDGDIPCADSIIDRVSCRSCGRPLRGCDGGCDLFHLSVLRVFLLTVPTSAPRKTVSLPGRAGVAAIRGYQRWLSRRLPTCCPHTPTCSHYGAAVVRRYGLWHGARLAAGRIARCTGDVPRGTPDPPP